MTDITTRLLSMSEAMWMDRDHDELDALLLEAKEEIERLMEALKPFAAESDRWAPMWEDEHAPALHPKGNVCMWCGYEPGCDVAGFTIGDLRRARAALIPQQKGNADA
jgi:hypothetical protein